MNYLLEIVIFNIVIFTICGINMAKKGKLGMIQEYPKVIQDRCRELGLIQESPGKLTKKATIGKLGFFIGYIYEALNKSDIDTFALIWNEAADKAFAGILGKRQLEIIKEAGSISTFIDKDSQLKHIQSVVCELNEELDVVKNNAAGKMKAYIVTGISAGLILVIVLI